MQSKVSNKAELNYSDIDVVLLDPNLRMRTLMRGALLGVGFRNIYECRSAEEVIGIVAMQPIDLLILDLDADTEEVCALIRDIREGKIGSNPYVVTMALTWTPEQEMIARTLESGADDLIAKPVSPKMLADRTQNLVRNRKDFVVTTGYVGPDRRGGKRANATDLPLIKVPNTLRYKITGDASAAASPSAIEAARRNVKMHRVYRLSVEISMEAKKLERQLALASNQNEVLETATLKPLVDQANALIAEEGLSKLAPIGDSMRALVTSVLQARAPTEADFEVLRLHSQAIAATIHDPEAAAELVASALNQATRIVEGRRSTRAA